MAARTSSSPWPTRNLPKVVGCQEQTLRHLSESICLFRSSRLAQNLGQRKRKSPGRDATHRKKHRRSGRNLNQTFRRLRQTSIDEELFDVLSGYESLSKVQTC